jgi:asparagine synthase (glutamine-hydrolysing)
MTSNKGAFKKDYLLSSTNLGDVYPYWDSLIGNEVSSCISSALKKRIALGASIEIDPVSLAIKVLNPYLYGNRTLVKGLKKAPWMEKLSIDGLWKKEYLPLHGSDKPVEDVFIKKLKKALLKEVKKYIQNYKTVGILLSGGMDSRVVAGVVRDAQLASGNQFQVIGLTWGKEHSRDVTYARQITERFGWEWKHYPLTVETLLYNITQMGRMGAEASPVHLHAMHEVANTSGIDVVLAGSYGDSVGRAEFSGKHLTQLKPMVSNIKDEFGLVRRNLFVNALPHLQNDLIDNPHLKSTLSNVRRCEIEQECHYMRRMLQYCMSAIASKIPFYQMFTSPEVFGLMWGLSPDVRDNRWYSFLLKTLPGNLLEIPWARTGLPYDAKVGVPDTLSNRYHEYGLWLRNDLREEIVSRINSDRIRQLGFLNDKSVDVALKAWKRSKTVSVNSLDETFSWLASLHDFLEIYDIGTNDEVFTLSYVDNLNTLKGGVKAHFFVEARNWLRK